jgi:hypothetical protein
MDPDGRPKKYGSYESGSATLVVLLLFMVLFPTFNDEMVLSPVSDLLAVVVKPTKCLTR